MGSKNGLSGNRTTRKGAMCQWHMFSTDRSGSVDCRRHGAILSFHL